MTKSKKPNRVICSTTNKHVSERKLQTNRKSSSILITRKGLITNRKSKKNQRSFVNNQTFELTSRVNQKIFDQNENEMNNIEQERANKSNIVKREDQYVSEVIIDGFAIITFECLGDLKKEYEFRKVKATPTKNRKALSQNDNCSVRSASSTASSASKTKTIKSQKTLSNAKQSNPHRKSEISIENANENGKKMNKIQSTTHVEESQPSSSTSGATATIEVTDLVKKALTSTMVTKRLSNMVTDIIDTEFNTKIDLAQSKTHEQITDEFKIKNSMQILPIDSNPTKCDSQPIIINDKNNFTDPLVKPYFMSTNSSSLNIVKRDNSTTVSSDLENIKNAQNQKETKQQSNQEYLNKKNILNQSKNDSQLHSKSHSKTPHASLVQTPINQCSLNTPTLPISPEILLQYPTTELNKRFLQNIHSFNVQQQTDFPLTQKTNYTPKTNSNLLSKETQQQNYNQGSTKSSLNTKTNPAENKYSAQLCHSTNRSNPTITKKKTTEQIKKYDGKWCNTHVKIAHMIQNEQKKRNRQTENHQTTKQQQQRSMNNAIQYDVQQTKKRKIDRDDASKKHENITKLPRSRSPVNHSLKTKMFNFHPSTSILQPSSQFDSQYHYHPQTPSLPQHMQQQDKNKIESDFYEYLRYGLQFNPQPSQLSSNPQPKPQTQYTVPNFQTPSVQHTSTVNFPFFKMSSPALFGTPASTISRISMASTSQQLNNSLHLNDHRHHILPPALPLGQNLNPTFNQHKHHQADFQKDQSKAHQSQLKRTPSAHGLSNNNTNSIKNVYSIPDEPTIQFMQHHHNRLLPHHVSPLPPPPPLTPLHPQNQFMPQLYNNHKNLLTNFPLPPTMFNPNLSIKSNPQNNSNTTLLFNHISQASS